MHQKKTWGILLLMVGSILVLSRCLNRAEAADPRGRMYAGSQACRQCHQAIYDSFALTNHFNATNLANKKTLMGSFASGNNLYAYDSTTKVMMQEKDGLYQQLLLRDGNEVEAYDLAIVFGRRHAQTFTYWKDDQTFELPLSWYSSIHGWATSPGYQPGVPNFSRVVGTDCYDCHSSFVETRATANMNGISRQLEKSTLIYGIDCERCHGPAMNHVNYHLANEDEKVGKYIVRNANLSRQQKLDACAVCHSGNDRVKLMSRFKFHMGDTLENIFVPFQPRVVNNDFDVHGNQYRLLSQSKCFIASKAMTCITCHDPHKDASENLAIYSQQCMTCHQETSEHFCPKVKELGPLIKQNCIDCHMPAQASKAISFYEQGKADKSSYMLRTHRIAVYGEKKSD